MILITGATGFLGRNLCELLLQKNYSVRVLARSTSDVSFLSRAEIAYGDVTDYGSVQAAIRGCEMVVHAAALFRFWGPLEPFEHTNVRGTRNVLRAAVAEKVTRFIHVSTIGVVGVPPNRAVVDESTPCRPQDNYQLTKLRAETLALSCFRDSGLPVIVLRLGALYGPWGHYAMNRLFFEEFLRGWRIQVEGGRHMTFPCLVSDAAHAIEAALYRGQPGESYVVSGPSVSQQTFNQLVSGHAGLRGWRLNIPKRLMLGLARSLEWIARWTGREPYYPLNLAPYVFHDWRVDSSKARRDLGFCPTPLEEGVVHTLDWYRSIGFI
jgi:dihydroflavonol-4-reductase